MNLYDNDKSYLKGRIDPPDLAVMKKFLGEHSTKLYIAYMPTKSQVTDAYLPFIAEY